uniref:Uncharacterized protein n=1 Tax=Daphnia galeata TaxID=27404 RepID=A0A8J2S5S4_9CRUS|nr:unnamed protein product [Daphnia galeata]
MSVFEKLGAFVSLCQACGMIPYTIKSNLDTKTFERFTFSFKHSTPGGSFLILILQLLFLGTAPIFYKDLLYELSADRTVPITVTGTVSFSYLAQFVTCRWIILHFRQLRTAVQAVQQVEKLFGDKFIAQHQSSLMTRSVYGVILIVIASTGMLYVAIPVFQSFLPKDFDVLTATAIFLIATSINLIEPDVFVFAALVAVVAAGGYHQPQHGYKQEKSYMDSSYSAPHYSAPAPHYKENKPAYHQPEYKSVPSPYHFDWAVKDDYTYNDYAHQESSDGKGYVSGSYRTLLPDGRTQIVTYKADDYSGYLGGYVADVKYEGYAKYPEYTLSGSYHKTPSYPEYNKAPAVKYEQAYPAAKY